jgi:Mg-chelatase subunit ChlD
MDISITAKSLTLSPSFESEKTDDFDDVLVNLSLRCSDAHITRVTSDIVVVVDVSGSMGTLVSAGSTFSILDIVKHSIRTIMETLNGKDRLSIVKYSDVATVVAPLTHMDVKG